MANKKITDLQLRSSIDDSINIPADDGIQSYRVTALQFFNYLRPLFKAGSSEITNLQLTSSVASSALTIALKTNAGTDATATDKVRVGFRSSTLTSGAFNLREASAALSVVVPSTATLGQASGQASRIYVYLLDNAGTPELAVSGSYYREDQLISTTAISTGATSTTVVYSTTARTSVPIRLVGYVDNTQTTAGTWASAGSQIQLLPQRTYKAPTFTVIASGTSTYYRKLGCIAIEVEGIGGGGGGGGSGTGGGTGGAGGNTTFGSLTGNGGAGGPAVSNGPAGGTASGGYYNVQGGQGAASTNIASAAGGQGASSPYGQGGSGGATGNSGSSAVANGAGGGGGASGAGSWSACGGAAGGFFRAIIENPASSYAYSIGAAGGQGALGTGTAYTGGAGGAGLVIIKEIYF